MAAYFISEIEVQDAERYEAYKTLAPQSIAAYGGRFIARGTPLETMEGDWHPERFVIVEFPTVERAKEWWASPEYADAKALRQATTKTKMILVEGFSG